MTSGRTLTRVVLGGTLCAALVAFGQNVVFGQTDTAPATGGVSASGAVPHGAVIVTLKDQQTSLPATPANIPRRKAVLRGEQDQVLADAGIADGKGVTHYTLVNAVSLTVTSAQAATLAADPGVRSIVPDGKVAVITPSAGTTASNHKAAPAPRPAPAPGNPDTLCPSDPAQPLRQPESLGLIKAASSDGQDSAWRYATGSGVRVAVFAEAIDPAAPDYVRPDGSSAIVDYQNFSGAPDGSPGETYGEEIFGDASTVAAQGSVVHDLSTFVNAAHPLPAGCDIRVEGVAPGADVVALKVLSSATSGESYAIASNMAQAIDYAVTVDHVDILSESVGALGTPDSSTADAVQQFNDMAVQAGVTVVAAAGDAGDTGTVNSPAVDPNVISAAGSTANQALMQSGYTGTTLSDGKWVDGNIAGFSSGGVTDGGTVPVLTAPADEGWAACTDKTNMPGCTTFATDANGNPRPSSIELFGGTSQAAPTIAGVAALVIQAYRDTHHGVSPSPALVRQFLTSTADDLGASGSDQGAGQVDALSAVRTAMAYQHKGNSAANGGLVLSRDQFTDVGTQGSAQNDTVTITNTGGRAVRLQPTVRQLAPIAAQLDSTVSLNPATGPYFTNQLGQQATYTTMTFTVRPGASQFALALAYPSASGVSAESVAPQVTATLLDPTGAYVLTSHPQGGSGSSNYGNVEVVKPKPGVWTAVFSTTVATGGVLGVPFTVPAYSGPVKVSITQNAWISAGTVSPATATIPPGKSVSLTAHTRMPIAAGDSVLNWNLGAPASAGSPNVSIVQRVLIGLQSGTGRFSGGLTGGNGRAQQPAQQQTFAVDVPPGAPNLGVIVQTSAADAIPNVVVSLVDPNGQVQSSENNGNAAANTAAVSRTVADHAADPIPGQWRIVVRTVSPSTGLDLVVPFTGTVGFGPGPATSPDLGKYATSNATEATLPADQATTMSVQVTNDTGATQTYYADPRTTTAAPVPVSTVATQMPAPVTAAVEPSVILPPDTSGISATLASSLPLQTQISGPSAPVLLAGPDALGPPVQPVNGIAQSTATMAVPSGALTTGDYRVMAGSVGPFGPQGAPQGTATGPVTATTLGFDDTVLPQGGDPFVPGARGVTGVTVPAGQSTTLTLAVRPNAAVGTSVSGVINIVQQGNDSPFAGLITPTLASTYQVVGAFHYRYQVAPGVPAISGTLSSAGGAVAGVRAIAYSPQGAQINYGISDAQGHYSIDGLPAGPYSVCFDATHASPAPAAGLLSDCYDNTAWDGTSAPPPGTQTVTVPASGGPVTGIDQTLQPAAGIQGTVTNTGGTPLPDVFVDVFGANGTLLTSAPSATDGTYRITNLPAGNVYVCEQPGTQTPPGPGGGYAQECDGQPWDGLSAPNTGSYTPVDLRGGTVSTVDITVDVASAITGSITNAAGQAVSAFVFAYNSAGLPVSLALTSDSDASYTIGGLVPGAYTVCVDPLDVGYDAQCYNDVAWSVPGGAPPAGATPVNVPANATVNGIDFVLAQTTNPAANAAALARLAKLSPVVAYELRQHNSD